MLRAFYLLVLCGVTDTPASTELPLSPELERVLLGLDFALDESDLVVCSGDKRCGSVIFSMRVVLVVPPELECVSGGGGESGNELSRLGVVISDDEPLLLPPLALLDEPEPV